MSAFYYQGRLAKDTSIQLSEEESLHCTKVLRLSSGDAVEIMNGDGQVFSGILAGHNKKKVGVLLTKESKTHLRSYFLHIAIAPTKNTDRIEWFIEKAVEIGIDKISFISSRYSERKNIRIERIQKRAISALKQSGNPILPQINDIIPFKQVFQNINESQRFLAYEQTETNESFFSKANLNGSYFVLVGPEGGFSEDELALAKNEECQLVSLGENRLRTETAGIATCFAINTKHLDQKK
jgi:16S rRNA (uracil1498-N3)-methyltransferase